MFVDIQNLLQEWGVNLSLILLVIASFSILCMVSLREFLGWFLRTNRIMKNQRDLETRFEAFESKLNLIEAQIKTIAPQIKPENPKTEIESTMMKAAPVDSRFPVNLF